MDIEGPEDCDLLVIGASLTGSAAARDASGRGLRVCLIERGDLAATAAPAALALGGASSAGDGFAALREAQAERMRLLAAAPHAVRPIRVVRPAARPTWRERALLAPLLSADLGRAPHAELLKPGLGSGREEPDCRIDEARLVVLACLDARERGASIRPHCEALSLKRRTDHWEALVRTPRGEHRINAGAILNAAGPAAGAVLAMAFPGRAPHTPGLVCDHLMIVPRLYPGAHGYRFAGADGTNLTLQPLERDFTLLALTGAPAAASEAPPLADRAAICAAAAAFLSAPLASMPVLASMARLRAVPDRGAASSPQAREGLMPEAGSPPTFLTLTGGPLITHRLRAEHAVDQLGAPGKRWTADAPLPGGQIDWLRYPAFIADQQRRWPWLGPETAARLTRSYGTRMARLLAGASSPADLGTHLGGGLYSAELAYLVNHEFARSTQDALWRRSLLGLSLGADDQARVDDWFARVALMD